MKANDRLNSVAVFMNETSNSQYHWLSSFCLNCFEAKFTVFQTYM